MSKVILTISGEQGAGKTRLAHHLIRKLFADAPTVVVETKIDGQKFAEERGADYCLGQVVPGIDVYLRTEQG